MATAKVSEKSTKTEIWDAYRQLLAELQSRPLTVSEDPVKLQRMTAAMSEAKASLMGHFEATIERLVTVQQAYQEADQDLVRRKAAVVDALEQSKRELEAAIAAGRKQWEQERTDQALRHQRDEEAYEYNTNRKRRDSEEAYTQKTKEREAGFAVREAALAEQEQLLKSLESQVAAFPAELEKTANTVREETVRDLTAQATAETKNLKQALEHEKSILVLKLQSAESSINTQAKQITELQRKLDISSAQLKEMAVAVIQSKNSAVPPQV